MLIIGSDGIKSSAHWLLEQYMLPSGEKHPMVDTLVNPNIPDRIVTEGCIIVTLKNLRHESTTLVKRFYMGHQ